MNSGVEVCQYRHRFFFFICRNTVRTRLFTCMTLSVLIPDGPVTNKRPHSACFAKHGVRITRRM